MPADDLAQELIEAIVSGADDDASLKACALVARAFVTPSQRLIFRRMEFSVDTAPRVMVRLRRAAGLLKTSPHLSVFVLDLDLYMTSDLSALEVILRRLRNVQRFAFRGDQRLLSTVAIRTAFMDFLSQPPLCTFICAVDGGDVAPGMVSAAFASCREVHISASTRVGPNGGADDGEMEFHADPWPEGKEERSTAVGRVEQLHIRFSSQDVNNFLRHPAIIKYLGRLRRAALWSMQAKVFHALAPSSSTLTHLMLPSLWLYPDPVIPLLPALRFLELKLTLKHWKFPLGTLAPAMAGSMPQLEVLTFHFTTYPPPVAEPYPEIDAGLSAIPRLRELNISVEVGPWEVVDLAPYVGHFLARLPHMRAAGLLKFSPIFKGPWRPHDTILFPEAATD